MLTFIVCIPEDCGIRKPCRLGGDRGHTQKSFICVFLSILFLGVVGVGLAGVCFFLPLDVKRIILWFKAVKIVKKYFQ